MSRSNPTRSTLRHHPIGTGTGTGTGTRISIGALALAAALAPLPALAGLTSSGAGSSAITVTKQGTTLQIVGSSGVDVIVVSETVSGGVTHVVVDDSSTGAQWKVPKSEITDIDATLGGDNDDYMGRGTDLDQVVSGGGGDDLIRGGDGSDTLYGGSGSDDLRGYSQADTLYGGIGNDILRGGFGSDRLEGNEGDDELSGGPGDDVLVGGQDDDTLYSYDYDTPGGADDILLGNGGNDFLYGSGTLKGGDGNDTLEGSPNTVDSLDGNGGADTLLFSGNATNLADFIELDDQDTYDGHAIGDYEVCVKTANTASANTTDSVLVSFTPVGSAAVAYCVFDGLTQDTKVCCDAEIGDLGYVAADDLYQAWNSGSDGTRIKWISATDLASGLELTGSINASTVFDSNADCNSTSCFIDVDGSFCYNIQVDGLGSAGTCLDASFDFGATWPLFSNWSLEAWVKEADGVDGFLSTVEYIVDSVDELASTLGGAYNTAKNTVEDIWNDIFSVL